MLTTYLLSVVLLFAISLLIWGFLTFNPPAYQPHHVMRAYRTTDGGFVLEDGMPPGPGHMIFPTGTPAEYVAEYLGD